MNTYELVRVIIPVYNVKDYVDECLKSVINKIKKLKILLINDGVKEDMFS